MTRCFWCNLKNPVYVKYHDEEWGKQCFDDRYLFEMLVLESFQAGLSWECVLNKREAFREAFDNFDFVAISAYEEAEVIEVLYVSISHDAKLTKCNPWVLAIGDSNVRAFSKEWSDVTHLNVLLERNFQKVAVSPSVYNEHFAERDWTKFQDEQLVFEGQTLHICVY